MKYYHTIFKQLHFDYGRMTWSVNHIPFFGALMSVCDHRNIGSLHSITFYAFLKVLTNGKIRKKQADTLFSLIDLSASGEISFPEMAFWAGTIVAQKDHLEREFLYMHAWKLWVTFNENGSDRISTNAFRKTGLFFDFDYPTIYHMYRDYNWDDDKPMEFERFRFYLMSCIHFKNLRRATAKYLRYKKFKIELLHVLHPALAKVLKDNLYPAPTSILRAMKAIKIAPIEGQDKIFYWSDVFSLQWMRQWTSRHWQIFKLNLMRIMDSSCFCRWICKIFCCGLCCFMRNEVEEKHAKPLKPVIIRRDVELEMLAEVEKKRHLYRPKQVVYNDETEKWKAIGHEKGRCQIQ
ncbi:unnamed protein product [Orchesella dallaii]|uniref:EF-hand domain-containing protein n=1 Tax=Orchesella dallaii TaxID=48710 RepID=A0ABP1Q8H1_9HEXA